MKALMKLIYHIARRADWESARTSGLYTADSLATEGFIHCSTARQVLATAQRIFAGRTDLVLIAIDSARVKAAIRYENLEGGRELFPHIYGPLEMIAVIAAHAFPPNADGGFDWPAALAPDTH